MIRFGAWSTTLGLAAAFGMLVAALLLTTRHNRVANRLMAALLLVAALSLGPYVIGFAGFYDAYPWLSFAPFDFSLGIGPLLYLYVRRLHAGVLAARWGWHFLPVAAVTAYTLVAFALPLPLKTAWNERVHARWIDPLESVASMVSLAIYLAVAWRLHRRYRAWLAERVSDSDDHRQPWISTMLAALGLWLAVTLAFDAVDWFARSLTYYDRFGQYLAFAGIVLALGLESWRHAAHRFPAMTERIAAEPAPDPPAAAAARDWPAIAIAWEQRVRDEGWWREPGLTLAQLAARLGTNESYVSRAFNVGQGRNFNAVINAMRVAAVQARLARRDGADLLEIALDAGFASKASFNRVFRERTGQTPSAWRASHLANSGPNPENETTGVPPAA